MLRRGQARIRPLASVKFRDGKAETKNTLMCCLTGGWNGAIHMQDQEPRSDAIRRNGIFGTSACRRLCSFLAIGHGSRDNRYMGKTWRAIGLPGERDARRDMNPFHAFG